MEKNKKEFKGTYFISLISITWGICEFGIASIFTLFLLYVLHFSMTLTSTTYAYYYGFAFILPIFIGIISDKYFKMSTSLIIGFITLIVSQFILSFAASLYIPSNITYNHIYFNLQTLSYFIGLFFLALGASFTNLAITQLINSLNDEDSRDVGFSIFYPLINVGIMIGTIIMSVVIGNTNYYLYSFGFLIFGIILIIGLLSFLLFKKKYLIDVEGNLFEENVPKSSINSEINRFLNLVSSQSISKIKNLNLMQKIKLFNDSVTSHEKDRMIIFFAFLVFIIIFRLTYFQINISIVFFIDNFVDKHFYFIELPVQLFYMFVPLSVLIIGPFFIKFNKILEKKKIEFGFIKKTLISLFIISSCFWILAILGYFLDIAVISKVNMVWIILFDFLLALSELFFSIAGFSFIAKLSLKNYYSFFYGLYLSTKAISMYLSGIISIVFPNNSNLHFFCNIPINGLMSYFLIFAVLNLIAIVFLIIFKKKIISKMHLDDLKINSIP